MTATAATIDTGDMLLIHRLLRREIGMLPDLVRRAAGDHGRAKRVATHALEILDFLHTHHSGEDELVWPLLRSREHIAVELIDRMEREHQQIAEAVTTAQAALPSWATTADPAMSEPLAATFEKMAVLLHEHLAEEEANVLPLVARCLTQAEWDALADHGFGAIPPRRRLVILGHILEGANPHERARMLTNVPAPARIAFRLIGHRQYEREVAAVRR